MMEKPNSLALDYALCLLTRAEYSEFDIRCRMQTKGFSEQDIDQTLSFCQLKNWQNDRRFTEHYIYTRTQRGYGIRRIYQELVYKRGILESLAKEVLNEYEIDWSSLAQDLLKRKFPNWSDTHNLKYQQKIWRYMLNHGFKPEHFNTLLSLNCHLYD